MYKLISLFLICTLFACRQKSGPSPRLASDQFDSLQVDHMEWIDSTNKLKDSL